MSKMFTKVVKKRIERQLDENQAREQAGYRCGCSTTDHLQVIQHLVQKSCEYKQPLCLAFVDYEKAFDSVEHTEIVESLKEHQIDRGYNKRLVNSYINRTTLIKLDMDDCKFKVLKGFRQGDTTVAETVHCRVRAGVQKT